MHRQDDIYGQALLDYFNGEYSEDITVLSPTMEDDILPLPYLFRTFDEMPLWEQKALKLCKGTTLDIGCGASCHSIWLQENNVDVTAMDVSAGAVTLSRKRGLKKAIHQNIWEHTDTYDTLLLLMNGTGIFERLSQVGRRLAHLKSLLRPGGQILVDSSDIKFLFEDEDGGLWVDATTDYYGEVTFSMRYKGNETEPFNWLYMDFELLKHYAHKNELDCELICTGNHYEYLARLTASS